MGRPAAVPALLMRIVGVPRVERMEAAVEETASGEVMSQSKKWTLEAGLDVSGNQVKG